MLGQIKEGGGGRVLVRRKAGVQSTFSTTLNKKSHAKLTFTPTGLTQFLSNQKRQYRAS